MADKRHIASLVHRALAAWRRSASIGALLVLQGCGGGGSDGPALVSFTVAPPTSAVQVGSSTQLAATGRFADQSSRDITATVTWSSSAPAVATVSPGGAVNAFAAGSTTITATSGGLSVDTTVVVNDVVTFLHTFGLVPFGVGQVVGPLMQASDGNFYAASNTGGANTCRQPNDVPCGAIFRMTPAGDTTVIYSFGATPNDAYSPSSPLIQGADGALYGVTGNGGNWGGGTAYRITLDGVFSVLYSFGASPTDGFVPTGPLLQARDGNFYGTTASGGANQCANIPQAGSNCGTVYRITPAGVETVLYSFGAYVDDGVEPLGGVVQASDGALYGTTNNGGANSCSNSMPPELHNCGTLFRVALDGTETILHSFGTSLADGIGPQGSLLVGTDGALYGSTPSGGGGTFCVWTFACGTVFRATITGTVTILHRFSVNSRQDGDGPSGLVQASDGNFYGTTTSGGLGGGSMNGTAFRLTPAGVLTTLYNFGPDGTAPSAPQSGMVQGRDGAFYGVTLYSGRTGSGSAFRLIAH